MQLKTIEHIRLLAIEPNGTHAQLGLGMQRTPNGAAFRAAADKINDMAVSLLATGNPLMSAGAPPAALSERAVQTILGCTQMGATIDSEGQPVLMFGFGCHTLLARVTTTQVRDVLALMESMSRSSLTAGPATRQ